MFQPAVRTTSKVEEVLTLQTSVPKIFFPPGAIKKVRKLDGASVSLRKIEKDQGATLVARQSAGASMENMRSPRRERERKEGDGEGGKTHAEECPCAKKDSCCLHPSTPSPPKRPRDSIGPPILIQIRASSSLTQKSAIHRAPHPPAISHPRPHPHTRPATKFNQCASAQEHCAIVHQGRFPAHLRRLPKTKYITATESQNPYDARRRFTVSRVIYLPRAASSILQSGVVLFITCFTSLYLPQFFYRTTRSFYSSSITFIRDSFFAVESYRKSYGEYLCAKAVLFSGRSLMKE